MTSSTARHILITGASSGIGRALAIYLSKSYPLIIHGRDLNRLEETNKLCATGPHILWVCDFSDPTRIPSELEKVVERCDNGVQSFVHSAGMVVVQASRTLDFASCSRVLNVNYISAMLIISTLLKKRIGKGNLRNILFLSSIFSRFGAKGHSQYAASKAALDAAMRSMAVELAPHVRVNSICLGAISTEMAAGALADEEIKASLGDQYPLGIGSAADVVAVAEFLMSEKSRWLTGQQVFLDGGRTANMSLKKNL